MMENTKTMNNEQKQMAVKLMLSLSADLIEDLDDKGLYKRRLARLSRQFIKEVRQLDDALYWRQSFDKDMSDEEFEDYKLQISEQSVTGELELRKFLTELIRYE